MPDALTASIRSDIAKALRHAMMDRKFSSVAAAAKDLGVSRQRLHAYLSKKATPHADVLLIAMKKWGMRLRCLDTEFKCDALVRPTRQRPAHPLQLDLFDEPSILQNEIVQVRVGRKQADSLRLTLEIKLRAS